MRGFLLMSNGDNSDPPVRWPKDPPNGLPISHGKDEEGRDRDAGFVFRGTKIIDGKPHIYMWFTQSRQSQKLACEENATYQFEQPSVTITTANGTWDVTAKARKQMNGLGKNTKPIKTTIGGELIWGEPTPDYQPDWVKKENERRKKQGKKPLPSVPRPGAGPGEKKAYPYGPRKIPGVGQDGFEDAPDFTLIGKGGSSFDGQTLVEVLKKSAGDPKNPPGFPAIPRTPTQQASVKITMIIRVHYTTLLYCLDPFGCLGKFDWDYLETDKYTVEIYQDIPPLGDFKTQITRDSSSKDITMGPWTNC
jgi:hypothetical protein